MSVYVVPNKNLFEPVTFEIQMRGNVMVNQSPMNGAIRTVEVPGDQWSIRLFYGEKDNAEYPELRAFWHRLRGMAHQFRCWNMANPEPRGTMRGTPTLSGAAVEGANTIVVAGAAGTTLLPGDFLEVTLANSTTQLVEIAEATGTGTVTCGLVAPLRRAASSGATVVWQRPMATFILTSSPFIPHAAFGSGDFTIEAVEFVT